MCVSICVCEAVSMYVCEAVSMYVCIQQSEECTEK